MAILDTGTLDHSQPTHHMRWFLIGGGIGITIAIVAEILWLNDTGLETWLVVCVPGGLMLFPAIIDGSKGLLYFVVVAVPILNFTLWGVCFLLISMFVTFFRSFAGKD